MVVCWFYRSRFTNAHRDQIIVSARDLASRPLIPLAVP